MSVTAEELFTPSDAAQSLASADPTAVGADASQQSPDAPTVEERSTAFAVESASVDATIPKDAQDAISVKTASGTLDIKPQGVSPQASAGETVNEGAAVVYANTGEDSDTSVVPLENGIETFTNIRSEEAGEDFSMKVDLPGEEEVRELGDGTVAILDPTPDKPDEDLPEPVAAGTPQADAARSALGVLTPEPEPGLERESRAAVDKAGTTPPAGVDPAAIKKDPAPADGGTDLSALVAQAKQNGRPDEPAHAPTVEDLLAERRETEEFAETVAQAELAKTKERSSAATDTMNADNEQAADSTPAVVATVTAPASVDADGNKVKTSLDVDGDVITMHVEHQGAEVTYPIAADPLVNVVVTRFRVAWFPVLQQETYLSHWALGQRHIGSWHPIYCAWGWVSCASAGAPWYYAYQNGGLLTFPWARGLVNAVFIVEVAGTGR